MTAKIYMVKSPNTDKIYIGSTCMSLIRRMNRHRHNRRCSSYTIVEFGDAYIELLEEFEIDGTNKIKEREQYYIDLNKAKCVNKNLAYNIFGSVKERNKYYYENYKKTHPEKFKNIPVAV